MRGRPRITKDETIKAIIELYKKKEGKSPGFRDYGSQHISTELGISRSTVRYYINKYRDGELDIEDL